MDKLILLLPLLPLLSAALTHLFGHALGRRAVRVSLAGSLLTFLLTVFLLGLNLLTPEYNAETHYLGGSDVWGSLLFDPLSVLMAFLIAGISLIVHFYSVRYMQEERGYIRFFVLLDLMIATLLVMVSAGDLITLLIAWHLVGVLLYFLLGQDTGSKSAYRYGFWTFITYRIGDLPLILAAVLLFLTFDTWSLSEIFDGLKENPEMTTLFGWALADTVGLLIALSAFARSAQFLLHTWLPYTMEGPTPVSALMHAGIVNAGGFLLMRFAPLYIHTDYVLHIIFVVGFFTAVIGSVLMLAQNDIKKSLGYSTMGQMGFMIMECGVGAFSLAVFHLIAHGLFKGTMFLSAGNTIGDARQDDGVPKDKLYTFIVEKHPPIIRKPWFVMALITLLVPFAVLSLSHLVFEPELFHQQGALILLFFGWLTGAQLFFATYHMSSQNPWRLMAMIILSFTIVVIGYTLVSHAFGVFLYPEPDFAEKLYAAADIAWVQFDIIMIIIALATVLGWIGVYYNNKTLKHKKHQVKASWLTFYALISREFYIVDMFSSFTRRLLAASARINVWLRW